MASKLTEKRKRFCELYVELCNAKLAYEKAFDNHNPNVLKNKPYILLRDDNIKAYIEEIRQQRYEENMIDSIRINQLILDIAINGEKEETRLNALKQLSKNIGVEQQVLKADIKSTTTIKVSIEDDINGTD